MERVGVSHGNAVIEAQTRPGCIFYIGDLETNLAEVGGGIDDKAAGADTSKHTMRFNPGYEWEKLGRNMT